MVSSGCIKKAKTDPKAFEKVYENFYDQVYKYVYFRVNSKEIAEDLVSLIWEKVLYNLVNLKSNHPLSFKLWLFQITRNSLYEHYRQKKDIVSIEDIEIPQAEQITQHAKDAELNAYLLQTLQALPEKEKEVFTLKFYSDCKNKEIAKIMEISEKVVAVYLSRAVKSLKIKLENLL